MSPREAALFLSPESVTVRSAEMTGLFGDIPELEIEGNAWLTHADRFAARAPSGLSWRRGRDLLLVDLTDAECARVGSLPGSPRLTNDAAFSRYGCSLV